MLIKYNFPVSISKQGNVMQTDKKLFFNHNTKTSALNISFLKPISHILNQYDFIKIKKQCVNTIFHTLLKYKSKYISIHLHIFNVIYAVNIKNIHMFANKSKL